MTKIMMSPRWFAFVAFIFLTSLTNNGCGKKDSVDGSSCVPALVSRSQNYLGAMPAILIGSGLSTLNGSIVDQCIKVTADTSPDPTTAQRSFKLTYAKDTSALRTALSLDANVEWSAGLSSVEASANYYNSQAIDSTSAYLVLDVNVQFPARVLSPADLTDQAIAKLNSDPEGFYAQCGDQFVSSITKGGLFRAVYKFSELSVKTKESLGITLSANSGNWSGDASFKSDLAAAQKQYRTELQVFQQGGTFTTVGLTPDQLIAQAIDFGSISSSTPLTYANAYPVSVSTRSYYAASNFPNGKRFPDITAQLDEMQNMANYYEKARLLQNDLKNRLNHPGRLYDAGCDGDLSMFLNKQQEVDAFIKKMQQKAAACRVASQCGAASTACLAPINPIDFNLPVLNNMNCGPRCTNGVNSNFEFDRYGYCTRCRFTSFPQQTANPGNTGVPGITASECKYLRPGANTLVRYNGLVTTDITGIITGTWIDVLLESKSLPNTNTCAAGSPSCYYRTDLKFYDQPTVWDFTLSENISVGSSAPDSGVKADLINAHCQYGSSWTTCRFFNVKADICDEDGTDCGAP
ncbi:MAG: hypothetical protein WC725_00580 [Patescibacteria group bacterium]